MVIIVSIVSIILLVGLFALIKLTPHKGAGATQKPNPSRTGLLYPNETRTSDLN